MRSVLAAGAALVAGLPLAWADNCAKGSNIFTGNAYCQETKGITYTNFGGQGTYDEVTSADATTGQCEFGSKSYNGNFAPLDNQVSIHLRGPLKLKQMAVYLPGAASKDKKVKRRPSAHHRRHDHQKFHEHNKEIREIQDRAVGDVVTAVIDGKTVTWKNDYAGPGGAQPTPAAGSGSGSGSPVQNKVAAPGSASASSSSSPDTPDADDGPIIPGDWHRVAYYNSDSGVQQGLTLMGNKGANECSGSWGPFGNSLSYVNSDGTSCASTPQKLEKDNYLPTDREIAFFSDKKCSGDSCGYVRDDVPNYHGWEGEEKAFFFEFQMPDDGKTDMGANIAPNMPSIWLLNAAIPRMQQYGNCSCWATGCGEFDLFEVLHPEDNQKGKAKSTIHRAMSNSAGDSDYFARPFDKSIKMAAVMRGSSQTAHINILDDSTDFGENIVQNAIEGICKLFENSGSTFPMSS
ncbi:MAG: hypothetical protein M4579_007420 [Chaenotheca gracillima]|nr:MAG: hypothetical protein M4579_007420 [Chaenotheca gracillima]